MPCNALRFLSMKVVANITVEQIARAFTARDYNIVSQSQNYIRAYMPDRNIQIEYSGYNKQLDVSCVRQDVPLEGVTQQNMDLMTQVNQMAILEELLALQNVALVRQPTFANGYLVAAITVDV